MTKNYYLKVNRIFTPIRKWAWLFILLVAFLGLWFPKLGLLMVPIMLTLPIMGFYKGKYWCGNICPHGSLFDGLILPLSKNKKIPSWAKSKVTLTLAFTWFMYIFTARVIKSFELWGTISFLDKLGFVFVMNYLVVTIVGSTLAIFISTRTWCRFCPMGTFQLLTYKLGKQLGLNNSTDQKLTMDENGKCLNCAKCEKVCPIQLAPYKEISNNNQLENEACIRCNTCVVHCPTRILSLTTSPKKYEDKGLSA